MKARTIVAVPPINHVSMMRFIKPFSKSFPYEVSQYRKEIMRDGRHWGFFSIEIPYGWSAIECDAWFATKRLVNDSHFLVFCDDIFVLHVDGGKLTASAWDVKQFDNSCGKLAQRAKLRAYERRGCPADDLQDYM